MKPKYLLLFILLCSTAQYASAQDLKLINSSKEVPLYLKFDATEEKQASSIWHLDPQQANTYHRFFVYLSYPVYGNVLRFSTTKTPASPTGGITTVPIAALSNYNIKTLAELEALWATMSEDQQGDYITGFQQYYLVEIKPQEGTADIIPVKLRL